MSVIFDKMKVLASELYIEIASGNREIENSDLAKYAWWL